MVLEDAIRAGAVRKHDLVADALWIGDVPSGITKLLVDLNVREGF